MVLDPVTGLIKVMVWLYMFLLLPGTFLLLVGKRLEKPSLQKAGMFLIKSPSFLVTQEVAEMEIRSRLEIAESF